MGGILHEDNVPVLVICCSKCGKRFLAIIEMGNERIEVNKCPYCSRKVNDPAVVYSSI